MKHFTFALCLFISTLSLCALNASQFDPDKSDKVAEDSQFYQVITINDNTLTYVAYTATGKEYDRAVITKDFKTGKKKLREVQ